MELSEDSFLVCREHFRSESRLNAFMFEVNAGHKPGANAACMFSTLLFFAQANLYDTAGGERFRTLTSNYYLNSDAAILMYSVEDSYSFERLKDEVENAKKFVNPDDFVWALVGHKSDLNCEIQEETIVSWAAELGTRLNFFASSKTGENVVQLFDKVVSHVHKVRRGQPARYFSQSHGTTHSLKPQITKSKNTGKEDTNGGCGC